MRQAESAAYVENVRGCYNSLTMTTVGAREKLRSMSYTQSAPALGLTLRLFGAAAALELAPCDAST